MLFACAAAAATAATQNPIWYLSGAYHPPLAGKDSLLQAIETSKINGGAAIDGEALTVALDVVQAWAVLLTLGFTLIIFFFLAFCVCTKKDDGYDEFEISQGITTVRICHDGGENGVSLIPRINGSGTLVSLRTTDDTSEASSRYTLKRELPAIPKQGVKSERPISQQSSDHYASVSDPLQGFNSFSTGGSNLKLIGGVQVLPAGAIAPGGRAAAIKDSISIPVEKEHESKNKSSVDFKKGHQYSQVTKPEHAYAKVIDRPDDKVKAVIISDRRSNEIDSRYKSAQSDKHPEETKPLDNVNSKPIITAASSQSSSFKPQLASSLRSPTSPQNPPVLTSPSRPETNIPAALAISGRQRANEEMPYMTPAVLQPSRDQQPQHFSGDSQDSRGYTSISVREPLAALKARQAAERTAIKGLRNGNDGEGYYMTVSDDSADDMYACIYESGSRGNGSETYAQIEPRMSPSSTQPLIQSPSNVPSSPTQMSRSQEQSPPAPPSVDSLRHVVHSRQASASSATSTGMGSPVADKRGTRSSPLPPLPQGDASLYSSAEPLISLTTNVPNSPPKVTTQFTDISTTRSIEEMYAKVNKKPSNHCRGSSATGIEGERTGNLIGGRWTKTTSPTKDMSHSLIETPGHDASMNSRAKSCEVSWTGTDKDDSGTNRTSGNYESIPSQSLYSVSLDPGYETVKNGDPAYASLRNSENYAGYETVQGSDLESEPGYETLRHKEACYETVSEVTSKQFSSSTFEPGYETVASGGASDPGYESVRDKNKDYDPGYEELSHPRTLSETDPNYEQLKFTTTDHGYEEVKKQIVESNYELVSNYETQEIASPPLFFDDKDIPLYASVQKKKLNEVSVEYKENELLIDILTPKISEDNTLDKFLNSRIEDISRKPREFSLTQEMINSPPANNYPVMDSPQEVELPPLGEATKILEDNHAVTDKNASLITSPMIQKLDSYIIQPDIIPTRPDSLPTSPIISEPFTCSPEKSESSSVHIVAAQLKSASTPSNEEICQLDDNINPIMKVDRVSPSTNDLPVVALTFTSASPATESPEISSSKVSDSDSVEEAKVHEESPLPPPPIPSLDDVAASPPPPPPPLLAEEVAAITELSPPPPPLNGVTEEDESPIPPPLSGTDDGFTVTVNPMAIVSDKGCVQVDLRSQPSEESTANGSVESVVTVDAKTGGDPAAVLHHSQSSSSFPSSSDNKNATDEAITPV